jgi:putative ABC transport system substrate-binding protein
VASLVDELLALNVNVLVTPGTPVTVVAHRETSTVPIVCVSGDPVRTGFAESLGLDPAATSLACRCSPATTA